MPHDRRALDALVIGAGQAGLGVSFHLARHGIGHIVVERQQVADSWPTQRWDSFVLNTPNWMNRLPGEVDDVQPRDAFMDRGHLCRPIAGVRDRPSDPCPHRDHGDGRVCAVQRRDLRCRRQ